MSLLSRKIEVYDFYQGTRHWRYTDIDRPVELEGQTYVNRAIEGGRIVQSMELAKAALELTVPASLELLDLFRPHPPPTRVNLNLKRIRVSDGFVTQAWMGVVTDVDDSNLSTAKITCQSLAAYMSSAGLRRSWQVPCPLPLYSVGLGMCNVDPEAFRADMSIDSALGFMVTAGALAAHGDGYYSGGFLRWDTGTGMEHRFIVSQAGPVALLMSPAGDMPASVSAFPGCDHSMGAGGCGKFGNELNYGGQHVMPSKNITQDPVF